MVALPLPLRGAPRSPARGAAGGRAPPPPLGDAAWAEEFAKYRQIPQYQQLNAAMTLGQFKAIYLWEYAHRFWARVVGVALVLPLLWLAPGPRLPRLPPPRLPARRPVPA